MDRWVRFFLLLLQRWVGARRLAALSLPWSRRLSARLFHPAQFLGAGVVVGRLFDRSRLALAAALLFAVRRLRLGFLMLLGCGGHGQARQRQC